MELNDMIVCVEPNASHKFEENIMRLDEWENYKVFIYDGQQKTKTLIPVNMQLPSWVIRNTFERLKEKDKIQKEISESIQENKRVVRREYSSKYEETQSLENKVMQKLSEIESKLNKLSHSMNRSSTKEEEN